MANQYLDQFFEEFKFTGLTYDDVSLITQYADFLPNETDLSSKFTRNISLNVPFASAAMDTVTEADMAIAMALNGGIGIIHKNLDMQEQRTQIKRVKFYLNGFLKKARTAHRDQTVEELLKLKDEKNWRFHSFPVVDDDRKLVGLLTSREFKYCADHSQKISEIMVPNPHSAPDGTTINEAYKIMQQHKISILPIVDDDGELRGMYCFKDVEGILNSSHPLYNRDETHSLRVGAAVGPNTHERVEYLMESPVDVLTVDTAHGYTKGVLDMVKWIKQHYPHVDVVGGNVADDNGAQALIEAGADAVKVGVGPGSICTTRVVAGVGVPQLTAVYRAAKVGEKHGVPIIADGGVRFSGDVAKALVAGASSVMMGGVMAGTEESPGEKILYHGRQYVIYRGMGSIEAMSQRHSSADRYGQAGLAIEKMVPEGIEGMVPYAGPASNVLAQFIGGLRQSLGYNGCRTVPDLQQQGKFLRVTLAGTRESHPHDITITKDAPNYKVPEK